MYIADGRKLFYQWDLDREIIVTDPDITELHFSNDGSHHSLVCAVHNGRASVPNILLQQGGNLHVFAAEDNHTETARIYKILPRPKPDDYVYTETEVLRWETLETRMEELAQQVDNVAQTVTTQAIDARIAGYLAANPPQETDPTVSDWARQPEPPKALPDGGAPHQMLVTDAEGVAKWEDKLCYGEVEEVEILPQTDLLAAGDGQFVCMTPLIRTPAAGDSLVVTYNGTNFTCEAKSIDDGETTTIAFGNLGALGGAATTDPFAFAVTPTETAEELGGVSLVGFALDGAGTVRLSIRGVVSNVKQIEEKYIPGRFFGDRPYKDRVFLSEKTVGITSSQGFFNFDYPLVEGQTYNVNYNGQLYTLTARYNADVNGVVIGKWQSEGDEVPFGLVYLSTPAQIDSGYFNGGIWVNDGSSTATVSVVGSGEERVRIPEEYIEENATPFVFSVKYYDQVASSYTADYDALKRAWNNGRAMFCLLIPKTNEIAYPSYMLPLVKRDNNSGTFFFATPKLYGEQFVLRYEYGGEIIIDKVTDA